MPKKPRPKSPTPEVFQVEVITAARVNSEGEWEYLVKWAGYGEADNSWEPHENVQECDRLLKSFWKHVGTDDGDYPIGYQANAKSFWIEKEKEFFAKEFSQQEQKKKEKRTEKDKKKENKNKTKLKSVSSNTKSTKGKAKMTSQSSAENSDGEPSLMAAIFSKPKATITIPPKKRPRVVVSDDSDSEDNHPRKALKTSSADVSMQLRPSTSMTDNAGSPPASPTSLFSAESSPKQAKTSSKPQPKVKLMIEPRNVGSALSTKQRILQRTASGSNTKPKVPQINAAPRKASLSGLLFKKASIPTSSRGVSGGKDAKSQQGSGFTDLTETTTSPASYHPMQDSIPHSDDHQQPWPDVAEPEARSVSTPPLPSGLPIVDDTAVDEFLSQIVLSPRHDIVTDTSEPVPESVSDEPIVPQSLILPRPIPTGLKRIPKKWKWSGDLFMNTTPDNAEKLCTVVLSDATDSPLDNLRFSVLFSSMDSIRFTRLLNVGDLAAIQPSCKPVQQLAKLVAENSSDEHVVGSLATFMDKNRQIALTPLFLDNAEVASLVVFPSTLQNLCRLFEVPSEMQHTGGFVAAVLPWTLTPAEHTKYSSQTIFEPPELKQPTSHAIKLLDFPAGLRAYMGLPGRTYCVWWSPGDGTTATPGLETNQLHAIMKSCKAKNVGHKADVRVVFVHVGALVTLHRLPALAERRSKRPEINFYTYGSHTSVPRERWGVYPIYPLGGIVTFTPDALLEDPITTAQLMRQISKHPFWDCYLLPSVIGMAVKSSCEGTDPLSAFKAGDFPLHDIVTLVAEGEVSLLRAPPAYGHDPELSWVNSQLELFSLKASNLLEKCLGIFSAQYTNTPIAQLSTTVDAEISKDLLRMQVQPSIMENYRRFVIITASTSQADSNKDGFEWITLAKFDFKDNHFDKSECPATTTATTTTSST